MNRVSGMVVAGARAARRMSSRMHGARGQAAFWRPMTLHWRRTLRLSTRHFRSALPGLVIPIFAPRIVLQFISNVSVVSKSRFFAATRSPIVRPGLIRRDGVLHRETSRDYVSRERSLSRLREQYGTPSRIGSRLLTPLQGRADVTSPARSSPQVQHARSFSVTMHFAFPATRVSNTFLNHRHSSASSFLTLLAPAVGRRERATRASLHFAEPSRVIQRTELVWRQHQPAATAETPEAAQDFLNRVRHYGGTVDSARLRERTSKSEPPAGVPSFNAAQMDRLVDHVIQRVEKRARIERERRGW